MNWLYAIDWTVPLRLLGQALPEGGAPAGGDAGPAQAAKPDSLTQFLFSPLNFMLLMIVLFYLVVLLPQQRQMRAQQKELTDALSNLKKNDRVITSGGVHGTVVQTSPDTGTVTIRIDDSTGAKMTVSREAIARVVMAENKS